MLYGRFYPPVFHFFKSIFTKCVDMKKLACYFYYDRHTTTAVTTTDKVRQSK